MKTVNAESPDALTNLSQRAAGVLLHITSLPGNYGIGDMGPAADRWIDLLAKAGQRWWQMLPLGPCGEGNSPYRCYSAFAGNPLLISPERLVEDGLLSRADLLESVFPPGKVNYDRTFPAKMRLLQLAYSRVRQHPIHPLRSQFDSFLSEERPWIDDYATFMALRDAYPNRSWTRWPVPIARRNSLALKDYRTQFADTIEFHKFTQFLFFRQLRSLRDRAREAGVWLIGDVPIFVSPESADVWTHPRLFQLDRHLRPSAVAGVPPDFFSSTGQCWGNPLYNWKEMAKDNFAWWKARLASAIQQADLIRLDHFRGFESYWRIPAGAPTAKTGAWVKAPGAELLQSLLAGSAKLPLLAEDLGFITPAVEALRDKFGLPGMRVLQFGFGDEAGNPHSPHNFIRHCFAYTATHDNDTTTGWYRSLPRDAKRRLRQYAPDPNWSIEPSWTLIRILYASTAQHVIIPLQDLLGLQSHARMNTPGLGNGNWEWRLRSLSDCERPLQRLSGITKTYERCATKTSAP